MNRNTSADRLRPLWQEGRVAVVLPAVVVAMVLGSVVAQAQVIAPGLDCLETTAGTTRIEFGGTSVFPPIPADFFFPGSLPFEGVVELRGDPLPGYPGAVSAVVERKEAADISAGPTTIEVELVELSLVSVAPILVQGGARAIDSFFDITTTLNPAQVSTGFMTIQETAPGVGGTYTFESASGGGISVYARFNFFEAWPSKRQLTWDPPDPVLLESTAPAPWQYVATDPNLVCDPSNGFFPEPGNLVATTLDGGLSGEHGVVAPRQTDGCCLGDGTCIDIDPSDCLLLGGTPQGQPCTGTIAPCCLPDGSCVDVDPLCCDDLGGSPSPGGVAACLGDINGNGIDDACEAPIPTVSNWGLVAMSLLILAAGAIVLRRVRRTAA